MNRARRAAVRVVAWIAGAVVLLLVGPILTLAFGNGAMRGDWRTATHHATGQAPNAATHPEAIVQVYSKDVSVNTIADVIEPGYALGERLLRPAMVKVAKA